MAASGVFLAASLLGSAFAAVGSVQQGFAQQAVAERNAQAAQQAADQARDAAAAEEANARRQGEALLSQNLAATGAAGITPDGSPLLLMSENAAEIELDALTIRQRGEAAARRAEDQAALDRAAGRNALQGGFTGAGTALLTGAGRAGRFFGPFTRPGPSGAAAPGGASPAAPARA